MGIDNTGFFSLAYSTTRNLNGHRTEFYKSKQTRTTMFCFPYTLHALQILTSHSSRGFPLVQGSKGMGDFKKNNTIIEVFRGQGKFPAQC